MAFAVVVFALALCSSMLGAVVWTTLVFISAKLNRSKATLREIVYKAWH